MISYANMHAAGLSNKPFIVRWILSPLDLVFQRVGVLLFYNLTNGIKIMITTS